MPGQEKYRCFRSDDEGDHNTDKRLDKGVIMVGFLVRVNLS